MSRSSKWITGIAATIFCLAVLAVAGIWRLGLLPLLLPPPLPPQPVPGSMSETVQPSGEIYLSAPVTTSSNGIQPSLPGGRPWRRPAERRLLRIPRRPATS